MKFDTSERAPCTKCTWHPVYKLCGTGLKNSKCFHWKLKLTFLTCTKLLGTDYLRGNWVHFVNGTLSDISDLNTWSKNTPTGSLTSNFIAVWLRLQTNQNNLKFDHRSHMYMFCSARFWNVNKIIWSWQRSALKVFLFGCILYI